MTGTREGLPEAIQRFIDATNRGDTDAFVSAFSEDATLDDWGREFTGHQGVRKWDSTDNIGVRSHFDLVGWEAGADPDTYVVTLTVTGDGYNGTGPMRFRLKDGLIEDLRIS